MLVSPCTLFRLSGPRSPATRQESSSSSWTFPFSFMSQGRACRSLRGNEQNI